MGGEAQKRTGGALEETTHWLKNVVRQQHVFTYIRDAKRQAHPGPSGERNSHISALLISPRGLTVLTQWVQLWAGKRLDPAFTEPWLQAKVIGRQRRPQDGHIIGTASSHFAGSESSWNISIWNSCARQSVQDSCENGCRTPKVFIACDIKNGFGAASRRDAID